MQKAVLRIVVLIVALTEIGVTQASEYAGMYFGGKFGVNKSSASGTIEAPSESTMAYGVQGGYLQGGYNWDIKEAIIGVGAYADFNSNERHSNGVEYGSRAYGVDTKIGMPFNDWFLYTKIGYGYSTGTWDLGAVHQRGTNIAAGVEYEIVSRWSAILEYKSDNFSNTDATNTISNKTLSFGLNYYFDRPAVKQAIKVAAPDLGPLPEPESDDFAADPPPELGASATAVTATILTDPESWNTLLENYPVFFEGANFPTSTITDLKSPNIKELNEIVAFAKKYPDATLELVGYSDNVGAEDYNKRLSLERAESVKKYMVKRGIAESRITTKGEGPANPIGINETPEGRVKNRRVEIFSTIKSETKVQAVKSAPATKVAPKPVVEPDPDSDLDPALQPP